MIRDMRVVVVITAYNADDFIFDSELIAETAWLRLRPSGLRVAIC